MNWIIIGMIIILVQENIWDITTTDKNGSYFVSATPLPQGATLKLNPYIKHWEPARYDRLILEDAHQKHLHNRRKREAGEKISPKPGNIIKLTFYAHDKEFRLLLREDPSSIFAPDVEIENSHGKIEYDISRTYTGTLEDDESSHVHGVLTSDNLFDGTIVTNLEQYYIEPSKLYSNDLHKHGIHSIVYKLSDVHLNPIYRKHVNNNNNSDKNKNSDKNNINNSDIKSDQYHHHHSTYCASERLYKKLKNDKNFQKSETNIFNKNFPYNFDNDSKILHTRRKRWLPEEMTESQNPPLPLDLDVPYNDDFNVLSSNTNNNRNNNNNYELNGGSNSNNYNFNSNNNNNNNNNNMRTNNRNLLLNRKNILVNSYNPNSDYNLRNTFITTNSNNNNNNNNRNNVLINNYDINNSNININNNRVNMSRPSHKTHVEIITKNGATKKPNIIFNNYNPDLHLTNNNVNLNIRSNYIDNSNSNDNSHNGRTLHERKSTCMLYLQADHTFFQKMGSDEASIEAITRHVQRANTIYKNTDFNNDGKPDNITFMIKRIKVHNMNALKDPTYRFPGNYGVEKFLELFSEEDYDAFCLAYMFTYRDFEMGTLGLAWTGDLKNAGGVCEKNGHYRGSLKSLNTGIVTLLNYGKHVPPAVSHVTLAHEIGHNFGSPHDPEQCTPGGEDGNFIMFARATSGDKKNNNKFSPCSLKSIEPVLNAKARSAKGCFTERQLSICGNGVVEPGEECDCGWEEDCKDSCCYPMSRHISIEEKPCTLTPHSRCSPSQGPCCTPECALKIGDKCRDDNGCRDPSFCDGNMPQCPPSINKPNKTICNKEFVCYMGDCTGSICLAYGLESCQCIPGPSDLKTKSCELCCKIPGESHPCKSSFEWNEIPYDVPDMFAKPGTPCNDYNGYCDVFQKCREVDPSGPLATLRKLLLSEESIASFKKWMISNWYTVALVVVAVFILLILSVKILGKKSNLKLKSVTIIHSATTETVRLPDDNNGVIVHTAIRSKVPLKKKVRGERAKGIKEPTTLMNRMNRRKKKPTPNPTTNNTINNNNSNNYNSNDSPKKVAKKKKRVSAPVVAEEQQMKTPQIVDSNPVKTKKPNKFITKSSSKHKEVIDYSKRTDNSYSSTFGKVHKWLLESPIVSSNSAVVTNDPPSATEPPPVEQHSSKISKILSKSQSTPERLTQRSPKKIKSVSNLNEKVRLQVVYKPPFKFSLKLSKNNGTVKTHVIGPNGIIRSKRIQKPRLSLGNDKNRVGADDRNNRRTALLIRTKNTTNGNMNNSNSNANDGDNTNSNNNMNDDDNQTKDDNNLISEPNYETLNPKKPLIDDFVGPNPIYENVNNTNESKNSTVNSATFRINKSASGNNINNSNSSNKLVSQSNNFNNNISNSNRHGGNSISSNLNLSGLSNSNQNLTNPMAYHHHHPPRRSSISNSNSNLNKLKNLGGSSNNLMRSSTTNLSKSNQTHNSLDRSSRHNSTTNLNKSNSSATKTNGKSRHKDNFDNDMIINNHDDLIILPRSRRNSHTNNKETNTNSISRLSTSNNSNNSNSNKSSLKRGSISNIPRASLKTIQPINFKRQISLQNKPSTSKSVLHDSMPPTTTNSQQQQQHHHHHNHRPHTAGCENLKSSFDWPKILSPEQKFLNDDPLPSDLEVFVSDVENLVNDN